MSACPLPPSDTQRTRDFSTEPDSVGLRPLGRTGLQVSEIGFGAGIVAGMFLRGTHDYLIQAVADARAFGINHFDTAPQYGEGQSETKLGHVFQDLRVPEKEIVLTTKVEFYPEHLGRWRDRVTGSVEESLKRLRRDRVDVLYLHNPIGNAGAAPGTRGQRRLPQVSVDQVLGADGIADALMQSKEQGLIRAIGFTAIGDADAVNEVVDSGRFDVLQAHYNLLNPSAGRRLPVGSPLHDFKQVICRGAYRGMGVVAIRVMAGGALIGSAARQGFAGTTDSRAVHGVGYEEETRQARLLCFLLCSGYRDMAEASLRFVLDARHVSSALVGFSSQDHIVQAMSACGKSSLTKSSLERLETLWGSGFRGID